MRASFTPIVGSKCGCGWRGSATCFLAAWHVVPGQDVHCLLVGLAVEVLEQGVLKDLVVSRSGHEQGHAGSEFQVVGLAEDLVSAAAVHVENQLRPFSESLT